MSPSPYVVIVGNGRSGTNWLMTMLDSSPATHCRSELLDIRSSSIHSLPGASAIATGADMSVPWSNLVENARLSVGERDLRLRSPKDHYRGHAQRLGFADLYTRKRVLDLWAKVSPRRRSGEWPVSRVMADLDCLARARLVLKLNGMRPWHVQSVVENDPLSRFVHIVRHPGGALNSAIRRHVSELDAGRKASELELYRGILADGIAHDPRCRLDIDPSSLDLIEALAWSWRYMNESIALGAAGSPSYARVLYEDLAADPVTVAREVFEFVEVDMTADVVSRIEAGRSTSVWESELSVGSSTAVAEAWKSQLAPEHHKLVADVLTDSVFAEWWS
jgi:Sulfotransferase family